MTCGTPIIEQALEQIGAHSIASPAMPEAISEGTRVNRSVVRLIKGDITDLEVDAFVFCAQGDLAIGTGFGTAISVRGGPTIQQELLGSGPVATGEAVVSAAGDLKANFIIHAVGPKFQEKDIEGKLRLRAFRVFYDKTYADELDLTVRFAKALIASAGPVVDRQAALGWRRNYRRRYPRS